MIRAVILTATVAGLSAAAALGGCANETVAARPACNFVAFKKAQAGPLHGPVMVAMTPGTITPMPLNAVNIIDVAITNKIMVQSTNARRLAGGEVKAFARIVNCTDYALQVEGRTHFLDAQQEPVEPVTAWQRVFLPPHSIDNYSAVSTDTHGVSSYLIELREGT